MTTETMTTIDPFRQTVEDYKKAELEAPEGVFLLQLVGNLGKGAADSGAKYINLRFRTVKQATYDPVTGIITREEDVKRPQTFFHKYYVGKRDGTPNTFAIEQVNSWLHAVGFDTRGTPNLQTGMNDFDVDEALSATVDQMAWTRITHKLSTDNNGIERWNVELESFSKKPRYRIRINGAA